MKNVGVTSGQSAADLGDASAEAAAYATGYVVCAWSRWYSVCSR